MIRYALRCAERHDFEGWFRSSDGFEAMRDHAQISCTICGTTEVDRAPMAPAIPAERAAAAQPAADLPPGSCESVATRVERSLAELRDYVDGNSDYVGMRFVTEARAMHEGRVPERAIHGEARIEDARKLINDGVKVAPLPFRPKQRMN